MGLRQDDKASGLNLLNTPPGFRKEFSQPTDYSMIVS